MPKSGAARPDASARAVSIPHTPSTFRAQKPHGVSGAIACMRGFSKNIAAGAVLLGLGVGCARNSARFEPNPIQESVAQVARSIANATKPQGLTETISRRVHAKLAALALLQHRGDARSMFDAYAGPDGQLEQQELENMLEDAYVGNNTFDRKVVASRMRERLDEKSGNGDRKVSWEEFSRKIPAFLGGGDESMTIESVISELYDRATSGFGQIPA